MVHLVGDMELYSVGSVRSWSTIAVVASWRVRKARRIVHLEILRIHGRAIAPEARVKT